MDKLKQSRHLLILACCGAAVVLFLVVLLDSTSSSSVPFSRRSLLRNDVTNLMVIQPGYDFNLLQPNPVEYVRTAKDGYNVYPVDIFNDPKVKSILAENGDPRIWSICVDINQPALDVYFKADKQDEGVLDQGVTIFSLDCRSVDAKNTGIVGMILAIDKFGNVVNAINSDGMGQVEGVSMYDTTTALLSGFKGGFLWNFVTGELTALPFVADTHSLVYSWNSDKYFGMYSDDLSRKTHSPQGAGSFDGQTGKSRKDDPSLPNAWGPYYDTNHLNYLTVEGDYAYCSQRGLSSLTKVDMRTNEKIWTLGGFESDFIIYDINGNPYSTARTSETKKNGPWNHQHKFQHLGMGFFSLYDNNVGVGHEPLAKPWGVGSRNLILYVNEEAREAWEVFSHAVGDSSMSYGGTDPLPSANVLATSYVDWVHPDDPDHQYHVNVWEVNMATNEADWRLAFKGRNPVDPANLRDPYPHYFYDPENPDGRVPTGWNIYTADRAYPTVFALNLCSANGGRSLRFSPFNTVRTQEDAPGVAAVVLGGGEPVAQKAFLYQKAWLNRPEEIDVPAGVGATFTFWMNNQWGNQWAQEVNMAALETCPP